MASSQGGQGQHPPVLKCAAEAVARSLVRAVKGEHGTLEAVVVQAVVVQVSRQLQQLKEVLLAEHPDASAGAKNRCNSLRSGFAHALKTALSQTPEGQQLLEGPKTPPKARVEVRHTAARVMLSEVFTVGRAAECDVQTTGDATTSRLQFLVISLPQGLCIADAWSGGGTRVVRRETGELPASVPQHWTTFVLPHGERVTLMTGAKTTVTLGPAVKDLKKVNGATNSVNGVAVEVPRVPTMRLVEEAKIAVPKAVPAPAAPSAGPNGSASGGAAGGANGTVATTVAVAAPSSPGSCAYLCSRAIASLRSNMRAQQQQALKERLKGRLLAAQRQKLIAKQQLMVFQERLEDPGGSDGASVEDLRDFLDGLGVAPAPDDPCTSNWTCSICKVSQKCKGFRCPFRHRACRDCFLKQVDSKCPIQSCGYILGAADMQDLRFPEERCKVFTPAKVQESSTPCRAGCGAAFTLAQGKRQAWSCSCGAAPVCTACGVTPYHYHGKCTEVQVLRARWQSWISGGREAYKAFQKRLNRTANTQQRALQEALEIGSQAEDAEMQSQPAESPRAMAPATTEVQAKPHKDWAGVPIEMDTGEVCWEAENLSGAWKVTDYLPPAVQGAVRHFAADLLLEPQKMLARRFGLYSDGEKQVADLKIPQAMEVDDKEEQDAPCEEERDGDEEMPDAAEKPAEEEAEETSKMLGEKEIDQQTAKSLEEVQTWTKSSWFEEIRQQMMSYVSEIQARRLKELSQDLRDLPPGDESDDDIPGRDAEDPHAAAIRRQKRLRQQLEEKWSFPFIPGRRAAPGAINIECMRAIIQIFKLDDSLREEVEHLRDDMCEIVKVSSFQHGLDFESPAFPLILRDVSCQRCCEASHVDVTSHPTRGPGLWVCTRCDQTYDKDAMQARLVDLLHSIIQAWQSQEVICKKCRGLRLAQMQQFCECFGRYEASFKSSDFHQLMQVLGSLTEPHDLPWLRESLEFYEKGMQV